MPTWAISDVFPIRLAWFAVALPALVLNYFGQAGLLITDPTAIDNPFYQLAPDWAQYPLVALAALATVIASQAIISGVFSLTQQSIQLGFLPRMQIKHTTSDAIGQIYVPLVNWLLAAATLGAVMAFGTSDALAGAYGIAVSLLMAITTLLAALVAIQWGYSPLLVIAVQRLLLHHRLHLLRGQLDEAVRRRLVSAAAGRRGRLPDADLAQRRETGRGRARQVAAARGGPDRDRDQQMPRPAVGHRGLPRVDAEGRAARADPIRQAQSLPASARGAGHRPDRGIVRASPTRIAPTSIEITDGITRVILHYGFMQYPTIYAGLTLACKQGKLPGIDLNDITYYIGRETIIPRDDIPGMWVWRESTVRVPAAQRRAYRGILRRPGAPGRGIRDRDRDLRWRIGSGE